MFSYIMYRTHRPVTWAAKWSLIGYLVFDFIVGVILLAALLDFIAHCNHTSPYAMNGLQRLAHWIAVNIFFSTFDWLVNGGAGDLLGPVGDWLVKLLKWIYAPMLLAFSLMMEATKHYASGQAFMFFVVGCVSFFYCFRFMWGVFTIPFTLLGWLNSLTSRHMPANTLAVIGDLLNIGLKWVMLWYYCALFLQWGVDGFPFTDHAMAWLLAGVFMGLTIGGAGALIIHMIFFGFKPWERGDPVREAY